MLKFILVNISRTGLYVINFGESITGNNLFLYDSLPGINAGLFFK